MRGRVSLDGSKIGAARRLVDALEQLSERERHPLKASIVELTTDGPGEPYAIVVFKRLVAKSGTKVAASLREIQVNVLSEAARRAIWG